MITARRISPLLVIALCAACSSEPEATDTNNAMDTTPQDTTPVVQTELTWSEDIAPIMAANCNACHTAGGAAPFALESYDDVKNFGALALDSMETKRMPPWQADVDCRPMENPRIMEVADIAIFREWWEGGAPAGDATMMAKAPPIEPFTPTHTAKVPEPYTPSIGESDDYRCFVLDMEFDEPMYLRGNNVVPGNGLVHHVLVYALTGDQAATALANDAEEDGPGYTCFGGPIDFGQDSGGGGLDLGATLAALQFPNQIGSWVPGSSPVMREEDISIRIEKGSKIVMQIHYSAVAGEALADGDTEFQAILTTEPTSYLARSRPIAKRELDIPAGEANVIENLEVPFYGDDQSIVGMAAHMHLLGTSQRGEIERAGGEMACGLNVPAWDFDWQESYTFDPNDPLVLEDGDRFKLTCTYDNSAANQPVINGEQLMPRDVEWGDGTLDEMCLLYITTREPYTPPASDDDPACSAACAEQCGSDIACLSRCEASDFGCFGCAISGVLECDAGRACGPQLFGTSQCLTDCISSAIMLGGNFGSCMEGECGERWTGAATCLSGAFTEDACPGSTTACGM